MCPSSCLTARLCSPYISNFDAFSCLFKVFVLFSLFLFLLFLLSVSSLRLSWHTKSESEKRNVCVWRGKSFFRVDFEPKMWVRGERKVLSLGLSLGRAHAFPLPRVMPRMSSCHHVIHCHRVILSSSCIGISLYCTASFCAVTTHQADDDAHRYMSDPSRLCEKSSNETLMTISVYTFLGKDKIL